MQHTGSLHHIELNVSNLRRSVVFWGWLLGKLGFRPYQKWKGGRSWKRGNFYLVLVQTQKEFARTAHNRLGIGLNHLAFRVSSELDVDSIVGGLKRRKIKFLKLERYPEGEYYAIFLDPDGIKIELVAP